MSRMTLPGVCLFLILFSSNGFGQTVGNLPTLSFQQIFEQISKTVTIRQSYEIDEDVEVVLPIGQAIQFNCAENSYGLKDFYVHPAEDGLIWLCYRDTDGNVIDRRAARFGDLEGSIQPVADMPLLAIMKWEVANASLLLRFCLSSNKQRNQRELEIQSSGESKMASGSKVHGAYPPILLSEIERLAGFTRLWSEVNFNFAFFDQVPDVDWDQVLIEYLPKIQQAETARDYYRVLQRCIALLEDGHTSVWGAGIGSAEYLSRPPIRVQSLSGEKAIIVGITPMENVHNPERKREIEAAELKLFEEVTHIDGRAVKEILENDIYPYISASTPQGRDLKAYPQLLQGPYHSKVSLRLKDLDDTAREITLMRSYYPSKTKANAFEFRELEIGIFYVNLNSFGSDAVVRKFDEIFPNLQEAKGLILDLRHNGGGNSDHGYSIISMLTDKPIAGSHWKTRKYMPAFRAWGEQEQWYEGEHDPILPSEETPYLGPLVVLTGPATFSAAEDFVVALHAAKRATIVGRRTGGSTGQPLIIELPGGGGARICTKRDTYPDGREFVGVGVIPDVEVRPTQADLAAGTDIVLMKGVDVLRTMSTLKGLLD